MKKIIPLCFCLIGLAHTNAQTDTLPSFPTEVDSFSRAFLDIVLEMELGFPIGDFKSEIDKGILIGKGIGIFYRFKNMPVDIGFRMGDFSYDHVRRNFDSNQFVQITKNKIWLWHGAMRLEPKVKLPFDLYFEGLLGWRRYYTKTYSKDTNPFNDYDRFDKAKLNSDWGMIYGGAVGAKFILENKFGTSLDVQLSFKQSNSSGRFYIRNGLPSIQTEPLDNYVERNAAFSMFSIKIGVSLLLRTIQ